MSLSVEPGKSLIHSASLAKLEKRFGGNRRSLWEVSGIAKDLLGGGGHLNLHLSEDI
jgi:hypothetical protein